MLKLVLRIIKFIILLIIIVIVTEIGIFTPTKVQINNFFRNYKEYIVSNLNYYTPLIKIRIGFYLSWIKLIIQLRYTELFAKKDAFFKNKILQLEKQKQEKIKLINRTINNGSKNVKSLTLALFFLVFYMNALHTIFLQIAANEKDLAKFNKALVAVTKKYHEHIKEDISGKNLSLEKDRKDIEKYNTELNQYLQSERTKYLKGISIIKDHKNKLIHENYNERCVTIFIAIMTIALAFSVIYYLYYSIDILKRYRCLKKVP